MGITSNWKVKVVSLVTLTALVIVLGAFNKPILYGMPSDFHIRHTRALLENASTPITDNKTNLPIKSDSATMNQENSTEHELLSTESTTPEPEATTTSKVLTSSKVMKATTPEPEPERSTPEPTPENDFIVIHTGNGSTIKIPQDNPYAEPVPEWVDAKKVWGPAWEFHIYFIALGFAILGSYSLISIIRLWRKKHLLSQAYFMTLNILMLFIGIMKSLYFFVDGYNSNDIFQPQSLNYFVHTIPFPCITSAFSILFYALLNTTKVQLLPPSVQRKRVLFGIITGHFVLSITSDIVVGLFVSAKALFFVCQLYTLAWGIIIFVGYMYISKKLLFAAIRKQEDVLKFSAGKLRLPGINPIRKQARLTLTLGVKVTFITSVFGLLLVILYTFAIIGVYGVFSTSLPQPWPWWAFQFSLQLLQLLMCALISYVATQPFRYQQRNEMKICDSFCIAPCLSIFEGQEFETKEEGIYWNDIHGVSVSYSQSDLVDGQLRVSPKDETLPLSVEEDAQSKTTQNTDVDNTNGPFVLNANRLYRQSSNNEQNLNSPDGHNMNSPDGHHDNEEVFSEPDSVSELPRRLPPIKLKNSSTPVYRPTSSPITTSTSSYSPKSLFRNTHFGSWLSPKKPPTGGYRSLEEGRLQSKVNPVRRAISDVQVRTSKKRRLYSSLNDRGLEGEEFLNEGSRSQRSSVTSVGEVEGAGSDLKTGKI